MSEPEGCECGDDYDYEGNRFVDVTLCPLHAVTERDDIGPAQVPWIVAEVGCLECDGTLTVRGIYPDEATALANAEPAYSSRRLPEGDPRGRFELVPQPWESRSGYHGEGRLGWVSESGDYEVHVLPLMPDPVDPDTPTPP